LSIIIDDKLALDAGSITSNLSLDGQLKIKAVVLTHGHYDHIRDVPLLAMNFYLNEVAVDLFAIDTVRQMLSASLMNGEIYPDFFSRPENKPTLRFNRIEAYKETDAAGYRILALPTNHSVPSVGYQVTDVDGHSIFYVGDTGPVLGDIWTVISPELVIIEVTVPNRFEQFGRESKHLTPSLLREELISFKKSNGYLPRVLCVHMNPPLEEEIAGEIASLSKELKCDISLAYEGMRISL
jgi:ribonuclease BN (tRNA processing enzyme)